MGTTRTVRLKNGTEEARALVDGMMLSLTGLAKEDPLVLYELAMICRDRSHELFGKTGDKLSALMLIQPDGQPHGSVRNVVLSAMVGDGFDMHLTDPRGAYKEGNARHTPGPWKAILRLGCKDIGPSSGRSRGIAYSIAYTGGLSNEAEDRANALVMAAAPDLLLACENLLREPSTTHRREARAAIAKAKGATCQH